MTRALTVMTEADDIGEEKPKPQEPKYIKPTEPVINVPAQASPRLLEETISRNRELSEIRKQFIKSERDRLEQSLMDSEPARDELLDLTEEILNTTATSAEARGVAVEIHHMIAAKQEVMRNLQQVMGVVPNNIRELGDDAIDRLSKLVAANGVLSESLRDLCAVAGTVRVDEQFQITREDGKLAIIRRWVDVGDEEPDQDPLVDLKWLVPASIKLRARWNRLMAEHAEAARRTSDLQAQNETLQARNREMERENASLRLGNAGLQAEVRTTRPDAPLTPDGYYLRSDTGRWVGKKEGKGFCFTNQWFTTNNQSLAHSFAFKADADEILQQLQIAKMHRISFEHRETLRVVMIRIEDHS